VVGVGYDVELEEQILQIEWLESERRGLVARLAKFGTMPRMAEEAKNDCDLGKTAVSQSCPT